MWEQWAGVVQRSRPETLVLHRLNPKVTVKKAPGPGTVPKIEWQTFGNKLLKGRKVVLHTDSAKSDKAYIDGVIHDGVVHCKKRVKVNGRFKWINPKYVGIVEHKLPGSQKILKCKSRTQVIDRAWRCLKDMIVINQNCKADSKLLRAKLRSAQYEYWNKQIFGSIPGCCVTCVRLTCSACWQSEIVVLSSLRMQYCLSCDLYTCKQSHSY